MTTSIDWRRQDTFFILVALAGAGVAVILSIANGLLGPLNHDEGWYLMAARRVYEGAMPYRDFAFTQGPVMPLVYAPLTPLIERWGLVFARAATILMGWLTACVAMVLAGRLAPPARRIPVMCMAWLLVSVNVYHGYFTAIVKTYALAGLFLAAGFYWLCMHRNRPSRLAVIAAAAAFVMAGGTRLSLAVVGPVMFLGLWRLRHAWPKAWIWFGLAGVASALFVIAPFAITAPEGFWFGVSEYHGGRSPGGLIAALTLKAGFVSRVFQGYYIAAALGVFLVACRVFLGGAGNANDDDATLAREVIRRTAAASLLLVTLIHLASPFPYDDYQTVVYAPVCALLAVAFVRRLDSFAGNADMRLRVAAVSLLGATTIAAFSSPVNQEWFVSGRDRIWWNFKAQPDIVGLREAAGYIREFYDQPGGMLLTQDTYLAIESGCRVPDSMILGPFSYFPDMPTERALLLRVTNRELLLDILRNSSAPVAAFSGYGLSIAAPGITELPEEEQGLLWQTLLERYKPCREIPEFGQAHTKLRILRLRDNTEREGDAPIARQEQKANRQSVDGE